MRNNIIDFKGYVQHLHFDSIVNFRLPVTLKITVTSNEVESKKVSDFISDIRRIENVKIQIVREND